MHNGAQHIAFDVLNRLGLCDIKLFVAQYPTPHDCCVHFATVVTGGPATLARGRLATALPPPDFHRLESASFAWRTEKVFLSVRPMVLSLARATMFSSTTLLSNICSVHRAKPSGGVEQARAISFASLAPSKIRRLAEFGERLGVSTPSTPSSTSCSSSRTPVAEAAGAKTQVTGIVGALAVALLLVVAPDLLRHLPTTALAAVVIASAIGLIEVSDLRRIYRIQRWEFWLSIVCFVGVAVLGAIPGIGLAIVIAVIEFLWDGWRPHSAVLGRADGVKGYHDITRYPDARLIPGLVMFRWDAPLFFANAELFEDRVLDAVAASPTPVRWLVVAAEPVTSVDVTAADALADLDDRLREAGIELCFSELKDPVKDKLKRFGLFSRFGEEHFFPTIDAAVDGYLQVHAVERTDWAERRG